MQGVSSSVKYYPVQFHGLTELSWMVLCLLRGFARQWLGLESSEGFAGTQRKRKEFPMEVLKEVLKGQVTS